MLHALQRALRDDNFEVCDAALSSICYLGTKEVMDVLIVLLTERPAELSDYAVVRMHDLTGEWPCGKQSIEDIETTELEAWWESTKLKFKEGICYRLGEPLWLPTIIALLKEPGERNDIAEELGIITGKNIGFVSYFPAKDQDNVYDHALKWWDEEGQHFEAGCLYKYGHKQDITQIY